jgi:nicotinate-nucleotide adenylyltransferase
MKLATRRIDISSTDIRERVHAGRSIRGFVPAAVADFITAERLYR